MQKSIPCHPIKIGNWSFILPLPLSPWQNKQVIDKYLYLVALSQSRSRPIGVSRQLVTVIGVQVWGRVDRSYAPPFWTFCFTKIVYVLKFSPLSHSLAPPPFWDSLYAPGYGQYFSVTDHSETDLFSPFLKSVLPSNYVRHKQRTSKQLSK